MAKQKTDVGSYQRLKAAIRSNTIGNLYVFHGEEGYLMQDCLRKLRNALLDELTESFNYHRLNNETFDIRSFADAVENLPMMAEHTLVQVEDIDFFKISEDNREKISDILSDIPEYCTVVLTYVTVDWKPDKRLKKLWEPFDKYGEIVEFSKQEPRDLVPWISRHFANAGKRISNDLCYYLIDLTGGGMTTLGGEIQKICAYSGAEHIVKADIDAVVEPVMDAVVFDMTNLLGEGKYAAALGKLQQLLKLQQEPLAILGAVGAQLRRISAARILLDSGKQVGELMRITGMKEYPAKKAMEAARRFPAPLCKKAAQLVMETDNKIKTSFDDPERLLELLILQLAQESGRD